MEKRMDMDEDLRNIVGDFVKWRELYMNTQKENDELHHVTQVLREELRIAQDAEKTERYKLTNSRGVLLHQQDVISKLLGVKDENIKLCDRIKLLENTLAELKESFVKEKENWQKQIKMSNELHNKVVTQLRKDSEHEVTETKAELATLKADAEKRLNEINQKLHNLEQEKRDNIDELVATYESKLQKCQDELSSTRMENQHIRKRADANMAIYRKKLVDIERQYTSELEKLKNSVYSSRHSFPLLHTSPPFHREKYEGDYTSKSSSTTTTATVASRSLTSITQEQESSSAQDEAGDRASTNSDSEHQLKATSSSSTTNLQTLSSGEGSEGQQRPLLPPRVMFPVIKKRKLFTSSSSLL